MKPEITSHFTYYEGIYITPFVLADWSSAWSVFSIHIGWLFWYVEIEWRKS